MIRPAREGIVLLSDHLQVLSLNSEASRLFGWAGHDVVGLSFHSLVGQPVMAQLDLSRLIDSEPGVASRTLITVTRCTDGIKVTVDIEMSRCRWVPTGTQRPGYVVYIRDLGVEPVLQSEGWHMEKRLCTLADLSPVAMWFVQDDCVVFANRAAETLLGAPTGLTLAGHKVHALLSIDDHAPLQRQLSHAVDHEGELVSLQATLLRFDGETREVEISLVALSDRGCTTVQMVISDVTQRNREVREIERSRQTLRRLSANVAEAREQECRRIARELHDELGQSLSVLKMDIADCASSGELHDRESRVALLLSRLDDIMKSVRRITTDLRPLMLDDLGLVDAIEWLASDFSRRMGIRVHLNLPSEEPLASEKISITIYRIVQEALTNVARHSHAEEVHIALFRHGDELVLQVSDDGVGLPSPLIQRDSQFGLLGIQERAHVLDGWLKLENLPSGGACMIVRLPVAASVVSGQPARWSEPPTGQ